MLPLRVLVVSVLPRCSKPGSQRDELELRDMAKRLSLLYVLLRDLGTAQLRRTYRVRRR